MRSAAPSLIRCAELASDSAANIEKANADLVAIQPKHKLALADEQKTRALLSYATLRAPFDGVATERHLDTGQLVQPCGSLGKRCSSLCELIRCASFWRFPKPMPGSLPPGFP